MLRNPIKVYAALFIDGVEVGSRVPVDMELPMNVYAALFVNGVQDGPRIPAEATVKRGRLTGRVADKTGQPIALGPVSRGGVATVRLYFTERSEEHFAEIMAAPPLTVEPNVRDGDTIIAQPDGNLTTYRLD